METQTRNLCYAQQILDIKGMGEEGGWVNTLKETWKNLVSDSIEWSSKMWKMTSADVKIDVKQ